MLTSASFQASLSQFRRTETAAVTVDWVVLCALVTGLTLAMYDEVGAALGFHSDNITEELTNSEIVRAGDANAVSFEFMDGNAGRWSGASVTEIPGFGEALGPIGGSDGLASVNHDFIMASNVTTSTIKFDIYALDSLDNESGYIYINGQVVGQVKVGHSNVTYTPSDDVTGVQSAAEVVAQNVDLGGFVTGAEKSEGFWNDDIITVVIKVEDPGDVLSFGFGSDANQNVGDESFALDNFTISGVDVEATTGEEVAPET